MIAQNFKCLLFFFAILCCNHLRAQSDSTAVIQKIILVGNNKTKDYIILREMPVKVNDTINKNAIPQLITKAKENIYNTKLFISVNVVPQLIEPDRIYILIELKERWYTFPFPYVELADRSLNVWLHTYHADLKRLSYGIFFLQENLTGRNDKLEIKAVAGFNRQLALEYTTPYINKDLTARLRFAGGILASKEIPYISSGQNKLLYHQSGHNQRKEWFASVGVLSRKKIKKREWLTLSLHGSWIADSIANYYNADFFGGSKNKIFYPEVNYKFRYDDVDNVMYPLEGYTMQVSATKRGFGWNGEMDMLSVGADMRYYLPLGKNWFTEMRLAAEVKLPFEQPYYNQRLLGYGDNYIRGLEYYVIDGSAFGLSSLDLKKKLVSFEVPTFLNSKNYSKIPFTLYAKIYGDAGYAYSKRQSMLGNKLQYSGGFGLDIVTLYDIAIKIEFSVNRLGNGGIYLHK